MCNHINIFILVYGLRNYYQRVLERLKEQTQYPHRIIVGDNLSWDSKRIRKLVLKQIDDGLVNKAYFYHDNYKINSYKHMFLSEPKTHLTVMLDGDLLLPESMDYCWLTKLINYMEQYPNIAQLGYTPSLEQELSSSNTSYLPSQRVIKNIKNFNALQVLDKKGNVVHKGEAPMLNHEIRTRCSNGHYFVIRTDIIEEFYSNSKRVLSDGSLCKFILEKNKSRNEKWLQCRIESASISNLSHKVNSNKYAKYYTNRKNLASISQLMKVEHFDVFGK